MKTARDYMIKEIPVVDEHETVGNILRIFADSGHSMLPVVGRDGRLVGVIGLDELLDGMLFSRDEVTLLEKVPFLADFLTGVVDDVDYISPLVVAADMMQTAFFSVREDESMLKAAVLMKNKKIRRLIVINGENVPVGYIAMNQVCKAFLTK